MVDNYIINVNLCTTKPIKIEKNNYNSVHIYEKQIDGYSINKGDRILVRNQISHYLNNLYIVKKISSGNKLECLIFNKKTDLEDIEKENISNKDIFIIKYGNKNSNIQYIKSNNSYTTANIYTENTQTNLSKLTMVKNTFLLRNSEFTSLNRLYSVNFYLYYFKPIAFYNKINDDNIITELINNKYLNANKIIISNNKKYFLCVNNNGYLVLYLNNYHDNDIHTVKPLWFYSCDSLKNKQLLFDDDNNLQIKENYSLNTININNKSYKYKGILVNQGPRFNTLNFNSLPLSIPDKIELYEDPNKNHIYIDSNTLKPITLKFNKNDNIIRKIRLLKRPHPDDILSDSFRPSFNLILQRLKKENINSINNLKEFIYNFIKTQPSIETVLSTFLDKDEDKKNGQVYVSEQNLMSFIDIIINYLNNNNNIIPPEYYIFDNPSVTNFPSNMLDYDDKQTIYYFKLEKSNNLQLSKNTISINNEGQLIQTVSNTDIKIWETSNNIDVIDKSNQDLVKELLQKNCSNDLDNSEKTSEEDKKDDTDKEDDSEKTQELLDLEEKKEKKVKEISNNILSTLPFISTNYITSNNGSINYSIQYNNKYNYILINNDYFKINTYLKKNTIYHIYIVHSIPDIDDYNINKILNINKNNNINIIKYCINGDFSRFKDYQKDDSLLDKVLKDAKAAVDKATIDKKEADKAKEDADKALEDAEVAAETAQAADKEAANKSVVDAKELADKAAIDKSSADKAKNEADKALEDAKAATDKFYTPNKLHITYIEFSINDETDIYELNIFNNEKITILTDDPNKPKYKQNIFNLHNLLIFTKLDTNEEKLNILKYLNKKWNVYLTKNKDYNSEAYNFILYNNKLHTNINCINLELYKDKQTGIYNYINDDTSNITLDFCMNLQEYPISNDLSINTLFNHTVSKLYSDILIDYETPGNIIKFIKNVILPLKQQDFENNISYQFKHFLPYITIKNVNILEEINNINVDEYDKPENSIKETDIKLKLPDNYNEKFIILIINQDDKYKNGLYIRNYDNTITKLLVNINKFSEKMFVYNNLYDTLNMSNIVINKTQKSSMFFQLYEKRFDTPSNMNFNKFTKIENKSNICFDFFMLDYINTYDLNKSDLLFVDLASTKHFNIRKDIYIINLPDIKTDGCVTCNIYNFLKVKKNNLYLLLKNQRNPEENGIYLYSFKKSDTLRKIHKIEFSDTKNIENCPNKQFVYVLNGVKNNNSLFEYNNKDYKLIKKYDPKTCAI